MSEIKLFPLRRLAILSMVVTLIALSAYIQGASPLTNDDDEDPVQTTTSTTTTETSTTTTTTTTTNTSDPNFSDNGTDNVSGTTQSTTPGNDVAVPVETVTETVEEAGEFARDEDALGAGVDLDLPNFRNTFSRLLSYFIFSSLLLIASSSVYVFFYNSGEVRNYVNRAFKLSGFGETMLIFGKTWQFSLNSTIKLSGFYNIKATLKLPIFGDPQMFGLRIEGDFAVTDCNLDQLPLKLQVIERYLNQ